MIERQKRRKIWFQEQLESGTMDKSQMYLIYTKKKLPCDLPRKAQLSDTGSIPGNEASSSRSSHRKRKIPEMGYTETELSMSHRLSDAEMSVCVSNYPQSDGGTMVVTPFVEAGIDPMSGLQDQIDFIVNSDGYWKMEKLQQDY